MELFFFFKKRKGKEEEGGEPGGEGRNRERGGGERGLRVKGNVPCYTGLLCAVRKCCVHAHASPMQMR